MTEKRFNIEDGYYQGKSRPIIYDDESSDDYYFCGDYEDFKSICEQFNDFDIENKNLKKENKQLKEDNEFVGLLANHRGEMVSFANALIQNLNDEKTQDMWEKFKDEMYSKWKQKRGIE